MDKTIRFGLRVLGKIINVIADEKVLDDAGKIDAAKIQAFAFDQMQHGYYAIDEKIGQVCIFATCPFRIWYIVMSKLSFCYYGVVRITTNVI